MYFTMLFKVVEIVTIGIVKYINMCLPVVKFRCKDENFLCSVTVNLCNVDTLTNLALTQYQLKYKHTIQ